VVLDVSYIGKLDTEALEENVRIAKSIGANLDYVTSSAEPIFRDYL